METKYGGFSLCPACQKPVTDRDMASCHHCGRRQPFVTAPTAAVAKTWQETVIGPPPKAPTAIVIRRGSMKWPNAVALRPIRIKGDEFVYYEATTFPRHPAAGCDMYMRRLKALGYLSDSASLVAVDILDSDSDVLDTVMISPQGFEYLRRNFHFHVDRPESLSKSISSIKR